ncbi:uncharacterized protein BDR25DRAFT_367930 [Lindgomyces ingoldianus]|uniref:Uncharacterized protein n=1 Tax=Lindgomyces ingoldianus TaxID=673940 RepID=A0ACB6QVZ0_9PLEO|nr:uncharacterized protein BDR25DRAFT_367930 [Lindgomyces ingoldianus]KAF2471189.1 hypothetical protein BDR25DRAFT_367930 [Lindgomyces ingoldianus]
MLLTTATTQLMIATARVTNPNLTSSEFNNWYNSVLLPGFMENHNVSLSVRYKLIPPANVTVPKAPAWDYLTLYKAHPNVSSTSAAFMGRAVEGSGISFTKRDIGPNDVAIEITTWNPIQTFEGLREKKGQVPSGRPKVVVMVKIEPKEGGDNIVEEWYRKQHLDMLSMLPNYRRSTRYRSADGSKPRWLAIHEMDSTYMDPYQGEVLMGTELARNVMDGVKVFEASQWEVIFEKGNLTEKL